MAKFVPDIRSNRWVVIAPARVTRPHDNPSVPDVSLRGSAATAAIFPRGNTKEDCFVVPPRNDKNCPFCPEQDALNEELFRIDCIRGPLAKQGVPLRNEWLIRVIKNKFPITDYHEVIIHSPDHEKDIHDLPLEQVELILKTYRARYNFHQKDGTVMIFNNHDVHAGASLKHPHSQLVVVPKQINLDEMKKEPVQNEVARTKFFVAYCPDFSQWPYEVWIAPSDVIAKNPMSLRGTRLAGDAAILPGTSEDCFVVPPRNDTNTFGQITDDQISDLAPLLQKILAFIHKKFKGEEDVPYNYYIYHGSDWYLRIIPRLIHRAGFELGTGLSVNIVDPVVAAEEYRKGMF